MEDKLYIVIPAYNEEENIESCIRGWHHVVEQFGGPGSKLVVIDDGSKDGTLRKMQELQSVYPMLLPLTKPNGGHGPTVLYGYRYAIGQNADWVFQTDSDGQTDPDEFPAFWEARSRADAVLGVREKRGDGAARKFVENTVCLLLRLIFGVKTKDANAPFRLMKTEVLKKYTGRLPIDFNLPNIMLTAYFLYYGEKTLFIPISFKPRTAGKNSINIRKIMKIGWKALSDFRKLKRDIDADKKR